jgi:TolB-like protein
MPSRLTIALLLVLLIPAGPKTALGNEGTSTVAVFPVENLSGGSAPVAEIRQFLEDRLTGAGIGLLGDAALDDFMTRHRVRYAAGIDAATAELLKQETGVGGVVIASVELVNDAVPPKVALTARLVSVEGPPVVVWADDVGLSGDDAPGLLDLGLVEDYEELLTRALNRIADSLLNHLGAGQPVATSKAAPKFRPKIAYRRMVLEPGRTYTVAVLPFFNRSERRNAGDVLALLFARHLSAFGGFRVIDAGEVRRQLLEARVIMDGGVSIADADLVATVLDADFVLAGRVLYYEDQEGADANPKVDFSTVLIERASGRVVWSSQSDNTGDDGVRFFGRGRSATAHLMATQMVRLATEMIAGGAR